MDSFRKFMKLVFKILAGLIAIITIGIGIVLLYEKYKIQKEKNTELNYETFFVNTDDNPGIKEWVWHNEYERIQISNKNNKFSILRKVYPQSHSIYAWKNDDYSLTTYVIFETNCKPSTKIKTSEKFSDNNSKVLSCDKTGKYLSFGAEFPSKSNYGIWTETLDGFSFSENLDYWDFRKLDREITLSKAKPSNTITLEEAKIDGLPITKDGKGIDFSRLKLTCVETERLLNEWTKESIKLYIKTNSLKEEFELQENRKVLKKELEEILNQSDKECLNKFHQKRISAGGKSY